MVGMDEDPRISSSIDPAYLPRNLGLANAHSRGLPLFYVSTRETGEIIVKYGSLTRRTSDYGLNVAIRKIDGRWRVAEVSNWLA